MNKRGRPRFLFRKCWSHNFKESSINMEPYIALGKSTRSPFSDSTLVWRKRISKSSGCAKFKGAIREFYWVYTGINWARVFTGVYRDASGSIGCRVSTPKANMEPDTAVEGQWSLFRV